MLPKLTCGLFSIVAVVDSFPLTLSYGPSFSNFFMEKVIGAKAA